MFNCKICGHEFTESELKENHRIAVDQKLTFLADKNILSKMYDVFNCPVCGVQNMVGERFFEPENDSKEFNCLGNFLEEICDCDLECVLSGKCKEFTKLRKAENAENNIKLYPAVDKNEKNHDPKKGDVL